MASSSYIESAAKALPSLTGAGDEVIKKDIDAWIAKINSGAKDVTDLKVLDRVLANKTFIAGNSISLADLALFSSLHEKVAKLPAAEQYSHLNVTRYFSHISHLASQLPFDAAQQYAAFEPAFEGQPTIERKDVAAEKQKLKEQKQAAASAKEASAQAEREGKGEKEGLGAVAVAAGSKKEKKAKGGEANKEGGKKNKNEPAAPSVPIPSQVDLRVGKIVKIERHPDADSLYLEQVDFGEPEGPRTILSGLVKFVPIEEMQDRWVVGVCNLKPASMRGIKSYGMLLCASKKEDKDAGVAPVRPPEGSEVGDRVYVEGYEGMEPEAQMNPKKKIFETIQPNYTTTENFECVWVGAGPQDQENGEKTKRLLRTAKGVITAPGQVNAMLS